MATIKIVALSVTTQEDNETGQIARALVQSSAPLFGQKSTLAQARQMAEDLNTFRVAERLLREGVPALPSPAKTIDA